jgi:hypothetical protein
MLGMTTASPYEIYQRVPWYEGRSLNLIVLIAGALIFLLTPVSWLMAAAIRRHFGRRLDKTPFEKWLRFSVGLVCSIDLFCILVGGYLLQKLYDNCYEPRLHWVQLLGIAGALGSVLVLYYTGRSLVDRNRWWFGKLHAVLMALAFIGFLWFALIWRLFDLSNNF